jgi:hypothetical protein
MYNHMRNMFHMCVAISPIFCLLSRSFVNAKISRDKVIAVSYLSYIPFSISNLVSGVDRIWKRSS